LNASGSIDWKAERDGQPAILIKLLPDNGNWKTEVYTVGVTTRKMNQSDPNYWIKGMRRNDVMNHLKRLFQMLE
jgi:hypothetical protein